MRFTRFGLVLVSTWLLPAAVFANAALPMVFYEFPAMVIALLPVIVLEFLVARRFVATSRNRTLLGVGGANLASTLLGVPLSQVGVYVFLFLLGLLGFELESDQALLSPMRIAWAALYVGPYKTPAWLSLIGFMVFLIPAFFISVYLERLILFRVFAHESKQTVKKAVWKMNVYSYSLMYAITILALLILLLKGSQATIFPDAFGN